MLAFQPHQSKCQSNDEDIDYLIYNILLYQLSCLTALFQLTKTINFLQCHLMLEELITTEQLSF